jgi:hypothetical protein
MGEQEYVRRPLDLRLGVELADVQGPNDPAHRRRQRKRERPSALDANFATAEAALRRALELNPELDLAHSYSALLETELGRAGSGGAGDSGGVAVAVSAPAVSLGAGRPASLPMRVSGQVGRVCGWRNRSEGAPEAPAQPEATALPVAGS